MPSIKVRKIAFDAPPFRKLGMMTIPFASRMTVIAGHNGIGKSTIMALVANNSGLSSSQDHKSLFGKAFQGNLFDIAYIDYDAEYLTPRKNGQPLPEPQIEYLVNEADPVTKACSITGRQESEKARIVARSVPPVKYESADKTIEFGPDAKVPLPTIYLGMIRMFPVGEANPAWVRPSLDKSMAQEEKQFISQFINDVVVGSNTNAANITSLGIKGTTKLAKHPEYSYDSRCISLGQDSLGSIATALASFQQLKREWPAYPGGLLLIDEVDAGLHPHAQGKLVLALKKAARDLNLQIIATTHSTHVVEVVHPEGKGNAQAPDSVVYLIDTRQPQLAENFSLTDILDDMSLKAPVPVVAPIKRTLKVYFEDDEAAFVFATMATPSVKRALSRKYGIKLAPMPLGVGCNNLANLSRHDPYFKQVVNVVDADSLITGVKDRSNLVKLPGAKDPNGKGMSPERTLHAHIKSLVDHPEKHADTWIALKALHLSTDQLQEHLLSGGQSVAQREGAKKWWRSKQQHIVDWQLYESWAAENQPAVEEFLEELDKAVGAVAKRLQTAA